MPSEKAQIIELRLVPEDDRVLRNLEFVADVLADQIESQPWNQELPRAVKKLRRAIKHLDVRMIEMGTGL